MRRTQREAVLAQHLVPYPAPRTADEESKELIEYAECLNNSMQLIKMLKSTGLRNGECEISVSCEGWNDKESHTWELIQQLKEGVLKIVPDFVSTGGRRALEDKSAQAYY